MSCKPTARNAVHGTRDGDIDRCGNRVLSDNGPTGPPNSLWVMRVCGGFHSHGGIPKKELDDLGVPLF